MGEPVEGSTANLGGPGAMERQQDTSVDTSYNPYPPSRPFINTDYQRSTSRPITSFPVSNRDGVLSALRNLQKKMQKLEVERRDADTHMGPVRSGLDTHWNSSGHSRYQHVDSFRPARQNLESTDNGVRENGCFGADNTRPRARALESQLSSAEIRCQLLEKQLDYMRKMVQTAEHDRVEAVHKAETLKHLETQHTPSAFSPDYCAQLERIGELERDHLRLTATQTLAESKIQELEKKLSEERDHRKMLQERALDLETAAVSHQILLKSAPVPDIQPPPARSRTKKPTGSRKKKKLVSRKQVPVKSEPTKHYRLNLADIPFVAGTSTGPSHAVGANVQKVLALMKSHNLALCSSLYNGHGGGRGEGQGSSSPSISSASSVSGDQELSDLLTQLQDEFGQLSIEHQEYMRHMQEITDPMTRQELQRELDDLVLKMKAKSQQISIVRQHQLKEESKQEAQHASRPIPRPNSAMGRLQAHHGHCHGRSRDRQPGRISRPRSSNRSDNNHRKADSVHPSLNMLKDMRKLQSTLRRDDLCWE